MTIGTQTGAALLAGVLAGLSGCASHPATKGHEARDDLAECVERANRQLRVAQSHLQVAFDRYNELTQFQTQDPVVCYKQFAVAISQSQAQADRLADLMTDMVATSDAYFTRWEEDINTSFQSETMRERGTERMSTVRRRFQGLRMSIQPVYEMTAGLVARLQDQMVFLKFDLSPESVALLSKDAAELNQDGMTLAVAFGSAQDASEKFLTSVDIQQMPGASPQAEVASSDE